MLVGGLEQSRDPQAAQGRASLPKQGSEAESHRQADAQRSDAKKGRGAHRPGPDHLKLLRGVAG